MTVYEGQIRLLERDGSPVLLPEADHFMFRHETRLSNDDVGAGLALAEQILDLYEPCCCYWETTADDPDDAFPIKMAACSLEVNETATYMEIGPISTPTDEQAIRRVRTTVVYSAALRAVGLLLRDGHLNMDKMDKKPWLGPRRSR